MNFLKYLFIALLILVLVSAAGCVIGSGDIKSKPGYAKLTTPNVLLTDTTLALNFGPRSLKSARWLIESVVRASDHELEIPLQVLLAVLNDAQGLQLRIYEVENNQSIFEDAIDESVTALNRENWETIIKVREDDQRVVIMQSLDENLIAGLAVLISTPEDAVFVNLVGPLKPESIAMIAENIKQL